MTKRMTLRLVFGTAAVRNRRGKTAGFRSAPVVGRSNLGTRVSWKILMQCF